jgi:alkylmercury lyase
MQSTKKYLDNQLNEMMKEIGIESSDIIISMHKELLKGKPISTKLYHEIVKLDTSTANELLKILAETNDKGEIVAFSGLSLIPTRHQFIVDGRTFYTWCVLDAILFANWLDIRVRVVSEDSNDKTPIELELEGDRLLSSEPSSLYISWVDSLDTCNIRDSLCNHVSFWASEATANKWQKENPNGKLLTFRDFFESDKIGKGCC